MVGGGEGFYAVLSITIKLNMGASDMGLALPSGDGPCMPGITSEMGFQFGFSPNYPNAENHRQLLRILKFFAQMGEKLQKIHGRQDITGGLVCSLTQLFLVPKGKNDICMVYDGTDSGLNDAVWVPNFGFPTTSTVLRFTDKSTYMADLDIGEMFLNCMIPEELCGYCGVDVSLWFVENGTTVWKQKGHKGMQGLAQQFIPLETDQI
eukprot:15366441-Ditylum_brightwellii.AAC.3